MLNGLPLRPGPPVIMSRPDPLPAPQQPMSLPLRPFRRLALCLAAPVLALSPLPAQIEKEPTDTSDATARRIVDLHLKARGGVQALAGLAALERRGTFTRGDEEGTLHWVQQAPQQLRVEERFSKLGWDYASTLLVDAGGVWRADTAPDPKAFEPLKGSPAQQWAIDALFPSPFLRWEHRGITLRYLGEAKVDQHPAYAVKARFPGDAERIYLFDQQSFHLLAEQLTDRIGGQSFTVERLPLGLRKVGGVWIETGYRYRIDGQTYKTLTFNSIQPAEAQPVERFQPPPRTERWLGRS